MKIIDLSYVIENGMPTCGTPWHENVNIKHLGFLNEVGRNTHALTMGSHTGTHMDAPFHFIDGGRTIEFTPLDVVCAERFRLWISPTLDLMALSNMTMLKTLK